jgi:hypothetical protein
VREARQRYVRGMIRSARPLVAIPDPLRRLVADGREPLRQPPVLVRRERWLEALGPSAGLIADLPDRLDRKTVREFVVERVMARDTVLAGFVATQVWGYGTNGYGPSRVLAALADPRLSDALKEAGVRLKDRDPVGAFRVLCVEHRIPKLGAAFGSKYLYFADPHRRALIFDRIVRDWLARHAGVELRGRRDEREYAVWLLLAEQWAAELRLPADRLEMIIFSDGLPETSEWRPDQPATTPNATTGRSRITCADAIAQVLAESPNGMRAVEIAAEINLHGLYRRRDGRPLPAYQVGSIAHANRTRFHIRGGVITLERAPGMQQLRSDAVDQGQGSRTSSRHRPSQPQRVILLGCVKAKGDRPATAKDLYRSPLWKGRRAYAEASGRPWLILSAKYGLVEPDARIAPYDVTLADLPASERGAWGERTVEALERHHGSLNGVTLEVHAGAAYRRAIEPPLIRCGARVEAPLAALSIGQQLAWYAGQGAEPTPGKSPVRRRAATGEELERALKALDVAPTRLAAREWPDGLVNLDQSGLYSWWVDHAGAHDLSKGLGQAFSAGRIYAGQTGATKWPSGKTGTMTLNRRIGHNHIRGQVRGSTFRLTLAAILRGPLALLVTAPRCLDAASEDRLTEWIREYLKVAVHPFPHAGALTDLERQVLAILNPPLNLDQMPPTPLRTAVSTLRASLIP